MTVAIPNSSTPAPRTSISAAIDRNTQDILGKVLQLYERGKYVQAFEISKELGPLETWTGSEGRLIAGRLANNLGADRLGRVLHRLAFRESPLDLQTTYFHAYRLYWHRGPLHAWYFMRKFPELTGADLELQADWTALRAIVFGTLHDFERAEQCIADAEQLAPDRAWIHVEKSRLFELQDRHAEAIDSARHALQLQSWYRPAVQATAYALVQLNHDDAALELLRMSGEQLESGGVWAQLAALETELGLHAEARRSYQRAVECSPLLDYDKERRRWFAARQSDAAYYCDDLAAAADSARQAEGKFYPALADRLESPPTDAKRVMLPVGFVRQHHDTCVPATLAAISNHWSMPADHLDVAESICYDGTPAHGERRWAVENGFAVREFRVTWDAAVALLDRKVPFTLTTVATGAAHLQAVIGYDQLRRTLLIRDPGERHFNEFIADELFEAMRANGPRGMAMVPQNQAHLLDGLGLPDADLYDQYHAVQVALEQNDRSKADTAFRRLKELDANHRLTWSARGSLARYDSDDATERECLEQLLEQYPDNASLLLSKLHLLQNLEDHTQRIKLLEEATSNPSCDPYFHIQCAAELMHDARAQKRVETLVWRFLRCRCATGAAVDLLAQLRWDQQQREEALDLYRFAACLDDKDETRAKSYFQAARCMRESDQTVNWLRDRCARLGSRRSWPAQTLSWAFEQMEQGPAALRVLDEQLANHSEDAEFLLYVADASARYGKLGRASLLLEQARPLARSTSWLRRCAQIACYQGDHATALKRWQEVLTAEPLSADANQNVAWLLADSKGRSAAEAHLRAAVQRFPYNCAFRVSLIQWLAGEDRGSVEPEVREYLKLHPDDPWACRELAISLICLKRWEEASEAANRARELEPTSPAIHFVLAKLAHERQQPADAKAACRHAVGLWVDYEPAIDLLIGLCETKAERETELGFIMQALRDQVIHGDGVIAFYRNAKPTLANETVFAFLAEGVTARPDLWHCWSALTAQLVDMEQYEEALDVATKATRRFPLLPRVWFDLARVYQALGDQEGRIEALRRAREINGKWGDASRELAEAHQRQGNFDEAIQVLQQAIAREPSESLNYGCLADARWEAGCREEAIEHLAHAVQLNPDYEWAWQQLQRWGAEVERPQLASEHARELTKRRAHDVRSWLILAEMLPLDTHAEEIIDALCRALEIDPKCDDAHSMLAGCLAATGEYDDALAACRPSVYGDHPPLQLRAREASIVFQLAEHVRAIQLMRDVLEADRDYYWAWNQLADWAYDLENAELFHEAAGHMVRLAPQHPAAWNYLATAEKIRDNRDAARACYEKLIHLDQTHVYGVCELFELQLQDKLFEQARTTISDAPAALEDVCRREMEIRLLAAEGQQDLALARFRDLCRMPLDDEEPLDIATPALIDAGWQDEVFRVLEDLLEDTEASPFVGAVYAEALVRAGEWKRCAKKLGGLLDHEPLWALATERFFQMASDGRSALRVKMKFLKSHRQALRKNDRTWSAVGSMLTDAKRAKQTAAWLGDWSERGGATPATLLDVAVNYRQLGREAEALEINRHAAQLEDDGCGSHHRLWLAQLDLFEGRHLVANETLAHVNVSQFDDFYLTLHALVSRTVHACTQQGLGYRDAVAAIRHTYPSASRLPALKLTYRMCRRILAWKHRRFIHWLLLWSGIVE